MEFTEQELRTIVNGLGVAATRFDENARECALFPRIVEQFERQARDSRKLVERIQDSEGILMSTRDNQNCECIVDGADFIFCPLHRAAPQLLAACHEALNVLECNCSNTDEELARRNGKWCDGSCSRGIVEAAIAEAERDTQ